LKNIWIGLIYYKNKERKYMTSFKKPLIAIVSAVALATTTFLAPASATIVAELTVDGTSVSATSANPAQPTVPFDNKVEVDDALKIVVSVSNNTNVTATATKAKVVANLHTSLAPVPATAGDSVLTVNSGSGITATFYVFSTSTEAGSVVISSGGSSTTYYVEATPGPEYNVVVSVPAVVGLNADVEYTANITDVFGNAVRNAEVTTDVLRSSVVNELAWNATNKRYEGKLKSTSLAGADSGLVTIANPGAVTGLAKPVTEAYFSLTVVDLNDALAVANAKIAELEAKLANTVTKKKYNKLAKKWNKKFPTSKVKLVK
jgi:hypothetical protein